jgi:hypothetical protein
MAGRLLRRRFRERVLPATEKQLGRWADGQMLRFEVLDELMHVSEGAPATEEIGALHRIFNFFVIATNGEYVQDHVPAWGYNRNSDWRIRAKTGSSR